MMLLVYYWRKLLNAVDQMYWVPNILGAYMGLVMFKGSDARDLIVKRA